jgi:hypothetical protein
MTGEHATLTPPFRIGKVSFRCWIVPDGVNELGLPSERYEWRSEDGRAHVARNTGSATWWASVDGKAIDARCPTALTAMLQASRRLERLERRQAA